MQILNATSLHAGYTLGMKPDGRESVVVIIKGTFDLPLGRALVGEPLKLAENQVPLLMADEFTGIPGLSATLRESDFAPEKPRCDVLMVGNAHAPAGKTVSRVTVELQVGSMSKAFDVIGDRVYEKGMLTVTPRPPKPFKTIPITYNRAFGGVDTDQAKPERIKAYGPNPVGIGFYPITRSGDLVGKPLPNTEETGKPVTAVNGSYRPMSFGPIGRNFEPRLRLAGTYDQAWIDDVFPFLPADFDPHYYQSAPTDQQVDYPSGDETVELVNLAPQERVAFRLPTIDLPVEFTDDRIIRTETNARMDTILIEPDHHRVVLLWRASAPLTRGLTQMKHCVIGRMPRGWYRARACGKRYYSSIAALVAERRGVS